jgi:hypothetical protein
MDANAYKRYVTRIQLNMNRKYLFLLESFLCICDYFLPPLHFSISQEILLTTLSLLHQDHARMKNFSRQIYNKKYWKLPIVYGGFAALIYSVAFYQKQYDDLRQAVKDRNAGLTLTDPTLEPLDIANLVSFRDFYRENRDLSWIGIGALYGLQIMDAAVDAHLQEFDVSENLSLRWQPDYRIQYGQAFLGATFTFTLK